MSRTSVPPSALIDPVLRAIADPTRRELLGLLMDGALPVNRLAEPFPMSRPAISQHLRVLREAGLVTERRVGRERWYRLEPAPLRAVSAWVRQYERFWDARLDALGRYLEEEDAG
jgi:DNA-binding transcriptional ArsR family regulator